MSSSLAALLLVSLLVLVAWAPATQPQGRVAVPSNPSHAPSQPQPLSFYWPEPPAPPVKPVKPRVFKLVKVTACSPEDPIDLAYYRKHGYEGRKTRAVAAYAGHFPKGTKLSIPGYHGGAVVPVDSAGGSIIRRAARRGVIQIDVKFATYKEAKQWGSRWLRVEVLDPQTP